MTLPGVSKNHDDSEEEGDDDTPPNRGTSPESHPFTLFAAMDGTKWDKFLEHIGLRKRVGDWIERFGKLRH